MIVAQQQSFHLLILHSAASSEVQGCVVAGLALPSFPQHAVSVRYATEHRCGVVIRGPGLSDAITGTDPLRDNLPLQVPTSAPCSYLLAFCHAMHSSVTLSPSLASVPAPVNAQHTRARLTFAMEAAVFP